jgi:exopolysaccharide biosynthesis protein
MKSYDLSVGDYAITKGYSEENDHFGNSYLITKANLFDIDNTTKVDAYYNGSGVQVSDTSNTSFVGITLPIGNITISSNKNLKKLIGFTTNDFSQGTVLTSQNIGTEYTFNNNGTYNYFAFYCTNVDFEGLQVMINTGNTALPYEDYQEGELLNNGLSAVKIINHNRDKSFINESITIKENTFEDEVSKTKYWITKIPHYDDDGNVNELKLGFANDEAQQFLAGSTARDFSNKHNATVCINAGVSYDDDFINHNTGTHVEYDGYQMHGLRVLNHELISNDNTGTQGGYWYKKTHHALGITDDGLLVSFVTIDANGDCTQSYEESQTLGCKYVTCGFTPIMVNGVSQKDVLQYKNQWVDNNNNDIYYQRQVIGQNTTTKDIYILTSNGKGTRYVDGSSTQIIDKGLTLDSCINILQELGCDFAYQLDEGGSTSLIYRGRVINDTTDDSGKSERTLSDFLYVEKKILSDKDKDIAELQTEIGDLKREIRNIKNKLFCNVDSDYPFEIQRWQNGKLSNSLNLRSDAIQYYDNLNNKNLLNVDQNGILETILGRSGLFTASAKGVYSDANVNRPYSNIFIYPYSQTDAPYENYNALVMSFVLWDDNSSNQMIQFALPHTADPITAGIKPKYRTKTVSGSSYVWSNWFDIG